MISVCMQIPKPLIERKRRARINKSLLELEKLLQEVITMKSKTKKSGKIEKADILEIAVNKMKEMAIIPRGSFYQFAATSHPYLYFRLANSSAFRQGYESCLTEVKSFFENNDFEFSDQVIGRLEQRKKEQMSSLGFCSVIRHTNEVTSDGEVTSTSVTSIEECDSSMWRPW